MDKRIYGQMLYVKSKAPYYNENDLEIVLCLKGNVKVTKIERSFELKEGEFTLINRHIVHYFESEQGAHLLVTKVCLSEFTDIFKRIEHVEFLNNNEIVDVERPLKKQLNAIMIDLLIKLYQIQDAKDRALEIEFEENQLVYLLVLNYQLITHIKAVEEYPTAELMDRYYQIVEYIMENIHTKIMTEDIINLVYMNPAYFSQFMKRIGGVGFKEFVYYRKLVMTCKYLLNEELTMNEIALKIGITDMKAFYSNFKKNFHISPSKWRHQVSVVKDDCCYVNDLVVLQEFIEKYNIHRHRENTITQVLRRLVEYQKSGISLSGINIECSPYDGMGDTFDPHYQVYKHFGVLVRTCMDMDAYLLTFYPARFLRQNGHDELLVSALKEVVLLFGLQTMRKNEIIIQATTTEELQDAKRIVRIIEKKVGNLPITIAFQP